MCSGSFRGLSCAGTKVPEMTRATPHCGHVRDHGRNRGLAAGPNVYGANPFAGNCYPASVFLKRRRAFS